MIKRDIFSQRKLLDSAAHKFRCRRGMPLEIVNHSRPQSLLDIRTFGFENLLTRIDEIKKIKPMTTWRTESKEIVQMKIVDQRVVQTQGYPGKNQRDCFFSSRLYRRSRIAFVVARPPICECLTIGKHASNWLPV